MSHASENVTILKLRSGKTFAADSTRTGLTSAVVVAPPSSASEDGRFDCDTVVQSVSIMGVKSKPTTVNVHVPGEDVPEMSTFNSYHRKFECFEGRAFSFTAHPIIMRDETSWDLGHTDQLNNDVKTK